MTIVRTAATVRDKEVHIRRYGAKQKKVANAITVACHCVGVSVANRAESRCAQQARDR